jgi:hypothetical protein
VKGFRPVLPHTMDPTNLYIKGLPSNADELLCRIWSTILWSDKMFDLSIIDDLRDDLTDPTNAL